MPISPTLKPFKKSSVICGEYGIHHSKNQNRLITGDCLQTLQNLPNNHCSLIIGSPPYPGKFKRYAQPDQNWVSFMENVIWAACRVSSGYVCFVVNDQVKSGIYQTNVETLLVQASKYPDRVKVERPLIWIKNSPPNRKDWFCNAWEYILCFRNPRTAPADFHFDWQSIAAPPLYKAGGRFRQRTSSGTRRLGGHYPQSRLARPKDVLRATVGGGHMGSPLAHQNEAPYPESLITPLILSLSPEKSRILDPFLGSGTTFAVAHRHNRLFTGIDIRSSQIDLTLKRMKSEFPSKSQ